MSKISVVRVAVNNNFNCTPIEWSHLEQFNADQPHLYFVNCNIKTPLIETINRHDFKAVVTVNPNLTINRKDVARLYEIDKSLVAFVRVKYIPNDRGILELAKELNSKGYNVVLTVQRFNKTDGAVKYIGNDYRKYYTWGRMRWRLNQSELDKVIKFADDNG